MFSVIVKFFIFNKITVAKLIQASVTFLPNPLRLLPIIKNPGCNTSRVPTSYRQCTLDLDIKSIHCILNSSGLTFRALFSSFVIFGARRAEVLFNSYRIVNAERFALASISILYSDGKPARYMAMSGLYQIICMDKSAFPLVALEQITCTNNFISCQMNLKCWQNILQTLHNWLEQGIELFGDLSDEI